MSKHEANTTSPRVLTKAQLELVCGGKPATDVLPGTVVDNLPPWILPIISPVGLNNQK